MSNILDLAKLESIPINHDFFPYCQIDSFIVQNKLQEVLRDFPTTSIRGSIPADCLQYGSTFKTLLNDLFSNTLRDLIGKKFAIDLSKSVPMLTVRAYTNNRDGYIHTDTPSKLMTLLLYFNEEWTEPTGNLRLLRDGSSLENYFDEVVPSAGKVLIFKVTDNCWHGHYPFIGKRHAIQLNYVTSEAVVNKEMKKHRRSYYFKKLTQFVRPRS